MKEPIQEFKRYFSQMDFQNNDAFQDIYSEDIQFTDPIHQIAGIEKLQQYFNKLNSNLIKGQFRFTDEAIVANKAYLSWEMELQLKRPRKKVAASGISVLTIEGKIIEQRDYFDAGELFYENIPVLGAIIRRIKKALRT